MHMWKTSRKATVRQSVSQTCTSPVLENILSEVLLPHSAGMEEVEDAYKEDKQRGHSETVSIIDKQSAERGIQEAQHAKSGEDGSDSSSSNGNGSSSSSSSNGKEKVSGLQNAQTCLMICGCKRWL